MPQVAFHTFPVPDNSSPAFSTPVVWCR